MLELKDKDIWDGGVFKVFERARPWAQLLTDFRHNVNSINCPALHAKNGEFYEFRMDLRTAVHMFPLLLNSANSDAMGVDQTLTPTPAPNPAPPVTPAKPDLMEVQMGSGNDLGTTFGASPLGSATVSPSSFNAGASFGTPASFNSSASSITTPVAQMSSPGPVKPAASADVPMNFGESSGDVPAADKDMLPSGPIDLHPPVDTPMKFNGDSGDAPIADKEVSAPGAVDAGAASTTPTQVVGGSENVRAADAKLSPSETPSTAGANASAAPVASSSDKTDISEIIGRFDGIDSRDRMVKQLNLPSFLQAMRAEIHEIIQNTRARVEIEEDMFPLFTASTNSVWDYQDCEWFNGEIIAASAPKWYARMYKFERFLATKSGTAAFASPDLKAWKSAFEDVVLSLKEGAADAESGPIPSKPSSGSGSGSSDGASGASPGPSSGSLPSASAGASSATSKGKGKAKEYRSGDVKDATEDEILKGTGAFAIENLRGENYFYEIFGNDLFRRKYYDARTALTAVITNKSQVKRTPSFFVGAARTSPRHLSNSTRHQWS